MDYKSQAIGYADAVDIPVADPALIFIMSRIQDATARLQRTAESSEKNADRVFGAMLNEASRKGAGPQTDGSLSAIHAAIEHLHDAITRADNAAGRFAAL